MYSLLIPHSVLSLILFNASCKTICTIVICFVHNTMDEKCARTIHKKSLITIHLYYRGVMKTGCECLCNVCLHKVIMYQLPSGLNISEKCVKYSSFFFFFWLNTCIFNTKIVTIRYMIYSMTNYNFVFVQCCK